MNKYLIIAGLLLSAVVIISLQHNLINKYKEMYNKEVQNVEAYKVSNSEYKDKGLQYQMTISELEASRDSIDRKLYAALKELKVKPKTVEAIHYITSTATKTDTVTLKDTIFRNATNIDTIIGDKWYTLNLGLHYPSYIRVSPTFSSEKTVVVYTKKEYVNKPSKIFFIRWFQKKRKVVEVIVEEKNPYINSESSKFIKIVK